MSTQKELLKDILNKLLLGEVVQLFKEEFLEEQLSIVNGNWILRERVHFDGKFKSLFRKQYSERKITREEALREIHSSCSNTLYKEQMEVEEINFLEKYLKQLS